MRDLAEALPRDDGEMMRLRHDRRRVNGSLQRTRVERGDPITAEALSEPLRLHASVGAERHVGGSSEPILGAERGLAVPDQQQPRRHPASNKR